MPLPAGLRRRRKLIVVLLAPLVIGASIFAYYYCKYSRIVDERLAGGRWEAPSRLYARPLVLRRGLRLSEARLVETLEGLRYTGEAESPGAPGEFEAGRRKVTFFPRPRPGAASEPIVVSFEEERVEGLKGLVSRKSYDTVALEPKLITFLLGQDRERKHIVRYEEVPNHLIEAVVAIEDRRFFRHHGLDPVGIVRAAARNLEAEGYVEGASTLTQQLVRISFLQPDKTLKRKLQEAFLSLVLEQKLEKKEILELYLNEIYLGQVASSSIRGIGQAARTYFGKEVRALSLAEAALLAGMIQSPNPYSPYRRPEEAVRRRDVVLQAMRESGFIDATRAGAAMRERLRVEPPIVEAPEAPYFLDLAKEQLAERYEAEDLASRNLEIRSSLDLNLQALAEDVLENGLTQIEKYLGRRAGDPLQGALIALEPKTGGVVALVGGRSYKASQYNRVTRAMRQPGSAFKPFVYLAAFEATFEHPDRPPITPATIFEDAPTVFRFEEEVYSPRNNEGRYMGTVTARRALASSLNVATVKVAERVGYSAVAELWSKKLGMGRNIRGYPSLALGSFEATPLEMAAAYNVLANRGLKVEPTSVLEVLDEKGRPVEDRVGAPRRVVHEASAFLVVNMLRSVINEGTAYPVRELGFQAEAAGKTGTSNDNRDAWFAGFTPDLLCVVWVGFDDNRTLNLPAAEVALPIWVDFMKGALAGKEPGRFPPPPEGVVTRWIDKRTGLLATPACPKQVSEAFIAGTEPTRYCRVAHALEEPIAEPALAPEDGHGLLGRVIGGVKGLFKKRKRS